MSGLSWRDARLSEYRNHGPGAGVNDDARLDRPQHAGRRRQPGLRSAALLRPSVPGARRPARHRPRLELRHPLLEPPERPRQGDPDRQHRQPGQVRRAGQAQGHPAPQPLRPARAARATGALRPGARLQQLLPGRRRARLQHRRGVRLAGVRGRQRLRRDRGGEGADGVQRHGHHRQGQPGGRRAGGRGGRVQRRQRHDARRRRRLDPDAGPAAASGQAAAVSGPGGRGSRPPPPAPPASGAAAAPSGWPPHRRVGVARLP